MSKEIYWPVNTCRICDTTQIDSVLDFGDMALSGVFLESGEEVEIAPLDLGRCASCGLVQLRHSYAPDSLYGTSYGYESHLNGSMRDHLTRKARILEQKYLQETESPVVVDVASNDGTLLSAYSDQVHAVGIDPLIKNFKDCYPTTATKIEEFFSSKHYFGVTSKPANLVTSLSVLYDIESPKSFASDISEILAPEGIWHFEQSYLPLMVDTLSYDTVCHEHLTYLRMKDIKTIVESAGLQVLDASLNSINGGSIAVTAIKTSSLIKPTPFVEYLIKMEEAEGYTSGIALKEFARKAVAHKNELTQLLLSYADYGYTIVGLGASTKGNVLLQWLELSPNVISAIGDINPRKFGKECPGSQIPIISEAEIISSATSKTIALVLPWHFREGIVRNCEELLSKDARLLFPLPRIEVVS